LQTLSREQFRKLVSTLRAIIAAEKCDRQLAERLRKRYRIGVLLNAFKRGFKKAGAITGLKQADRLREHIRVLMSANEENEGQCIGNRFEVGDETVVHFADTHGVVLCRAIAFIHEVHFVNENVLRRKISHALELTQNVPRKLFVNAMKFDYFLAFEAPHFENRAMPKWPEDARAPQHKGVAGHVPAEQIAGSGELLKDGKRLCLNRGRSNRQQNSSGSRSTSIRMVEKTRGVFGSQPSASTGCTK
jgi:hypothetical protein